MANEKEKEEVKAPPPVQKKGKGMLIGIIAAVVVVLGAGGFFAFKAMSSSGSEHGGEQEEAPAHGGEKHPESTLYDLDPFIVNLRDNSGTRYLKLTVSLEVASPEAAGELKASTARIRDSLIILLSSKSYADIGTAEGKYHLRDEVIARANQFVKEGTIKSAYFTEFVIQ